MSTETGIDLVTDVFLTPQGLLRIELEQGVSCWVDATAGKRLREALAERVTL